MRIEDRILFLDGEAIVIDKPAGMPVDVARDGTLAVANHLDLLRFGFQRPPQPVHRLDRDTSGCLLLARNLKAHRRFADAFETGLVDKVYLAVLSAPPPGQSGRIELPLAKRSSAAEGWRMVADPQGKKAVTDWECLAIEDGRALVRFHPLTGRTHQIRAHAAYGLSAPIVGDPIYGHGGRGARPGAGPGMLLHALSLTLARPGKAAIAATAAVPESFGSIAQPGLVDAAG